MSGFFYDLRMPQIERSIPMPVRVIPSEIMKRLSAGIATSLSNSSHKPFEGRLGVLNFEIHAPSRSREMSIKTTGIIDPERGLIDIKTTADSREFVLILGMVFFVLVYLVLNDFSSKGFSSVIPSGVVFLTVTGFLYAFGWLSVKVQSSRHFQFIREAIESPSGFNWDRYRKQRIRDFCVYSVSAVITVVLITVWAKSYLGL